MIEALKTLNNKVIYKTLIYNLMGRFVFSKIDAEIARGPASLILHYQMPLPLLLLSEWLRRKEIKATKGSLSVFFFIYFSYII